MSNIIKRIYTTLPWALMVAANANSASAQQATPTPTVVLDPIRVPRSPVRTASPDAQSISDTPIGSEPTQRAASQQHQPVSITERNPAGRIVVATALSFVAAGAAEAMIFFAVNQRVAPDPAFMTVGLLSAVVGIPATYSAVSAGFGSTGLFGVSVLGNIVGTLSGATLGAIGAFAFRSIAVAAIVAPLGAVAGTAISYEASIRPRPVNSSGQGARIRPLFPSIFANETTQGITFSGSF